MLCAGEKIRFDDDLGLVSSFQGGTRAAVLDIFVSSAKLGTEGVERVGDHRVLHFAREQFLVQRGRGITEAWLSGVSRMNLIW